MLAYTMDCLAEVHGADQRELPKLPVSQNHALDEADPVSYIFCSIRFMSAWGVVLAMGTPAARMRAVLARVSACKFSTVVVHSCFGG
jgi:hypothetical protein